MVVVEMRSVDRRRANRVADKAKSCSHCMAGGSLLIAWQLDSKRVLIVGGGEIASQRVESILTTDAKITLISPNDGLSPRTKQLLAEHSDRITYHDRLFSGREELDGMHMVLTALDDFELSKTICTLCRTEKIPVNAADIPAYCDFYFGSQIRQGPLQIMVSTNGNGPKMANLVKRKLEKALSGFEGDAIAKVGELRAQLKSRAPGVGGALGKRRMKWITDVCTTWTMEELALLDHTLIRNLLDEGWENNRVPTFREIAGGRRTHSIPLSPVFACTAIGLCTLVVLAVLRRK